MTIPLRKTTTTTTTIKKRDEKETELFSSLD